MGLSSRRRKAKEAHNLSLEGRFPFGLPENRKEEISNKMNIKDCSICYLEMGYKRHNTTTLKCGHKYHRNCILGWHSESKSGSKIPMITCPQCRALIVPDYIFNKNISRNNLTKLYETFFNRLPQYNATNLANLWRKQILQKKKPSSYNFHYILQYPKTYGIVNRKRKASQNIVKKYKRRQC